MTMRRVAWRAYLSTLLAILLVGCGSSSPGASTPQQQSTSTTDYSIAGLRTDSTGQALVASYIGGSCDDSARLGVSESDTTVQVRVVVTVPDGASDAAGHLRTVVGHLDKPIGARTILAGTRQMVPFPGRRLLRTTTSTPSLVVALEQGEADPSDVTTQGASPAIQSTTQWTTTLQDSEKPCNLVTVDQRIAGTDYSVPGSTPEGNRQVGTVTAHLYRDGPSDAEAIRWTLGWAQDGGTIDVSSDGNCAGTPIIGPDELVQIAASLRPL